MKYFSLIILLSFPIVLLGKEYTIHFDIKDFNFEKKDGFIHISSTGGNMFLWGDTIEPALPCIGVNILVSPDEEYENVIEKNNEVFILSDAIIEPNPISIPTNSLHIENEARYIKYEQKNYPKVSIDYTGTHLMDGYKYLSFIVCPFRYDVINNQLFLKTEITLDVRLKSQSNSPKASGCIPHVIQGKNMHDMIKKIVLNGNESEALYSNHFSHVNNEKSLTSLPYEYVIVTNEALRPTFEKLAHWKTIKGVRTKVVTVEDCCDEYPSYTPQLAIKTVLSYYYGNGMSYALLGGDTNVVPVQMCYLPQWTLDTTDTPADLYYACYDNCFSWDANENNVYGEIADNIDLDPEIILTRVSVSNIIEAETFVSRVIEYESSPKLDGWTNKMLSCGNKLSSYYTKNNVQISDAQYQGEYVYENGVQDYWDGTLFELFDTYTDHVDGANYEANGEHLQMELEKGYTFVDEFSHGWIPVWGALENNTLYVVDKASSLVNNGYTTITTIACYTNAFDTISIELPEYTTCLSESFLRNPDSGVLAYYGSSREGWVYYSYYFDEKFYEGLLTSNSKQFGRAAFFSKNSYLGNVSPQYFNYYRWLIMTLNPMGDPEMPIYIVTPQRFSNMNIIFSNGNLSVTTGVANCRICITSVADNGDSYYVVSDSTNCANFSSVNSDCYLCVTKPGYIPYIARVGPSVYLQNETIISNLPIFSTSTYMGSDVTTSKPQGPVTIEKGKVTNKSHGSVTIKNNFDVRLGAELEITNY